MIRALSVRAALEAERQAVERGIGLDELMRRAGGAVAREVAARRPDGEIVVVAGKGNNAGDGWVAARDLIAGGRSARVVSLVDPDALAEPAASAAREAISAGVPWILAVDPQGQAEAVRGASAVIDAVFGIGLSGAPGDPCASAIEAINSVGAYVVSVDVPSGVDADSGAVPGQAVGADATVTFTAPKSGLVMYPGAKHVGEVVVADIGVQTPAPVEGDLELWETADYAALLPEHPEDIHKNQRGRVLVVAGSRSFPGAAALAVMGAQRMGAGYVTLAVPESILPTLQAKLTSAVVVGLPENPSRTFASKVADAVLDLAREHDSVVMGPGLTVAHGAVLMVRRVVRELPRPLVLDADGLNALVDAVDVLAERPARTVITPHPGELARLLDVDVMDVQSDRLFYGSRLVSHSLTCILKGARTIVSGEGRQLATLAGNPGLATAGTGDVLSGMIGTLLAQDISPLEAGALGAYLHGRAGDLAASELSETCVMAEDVPAFLPGAVKELRASRGISRMTRPDAEGDVG